MNIVQIGVCEAYDDLTQLINNNQPDKLILIEPLNVHNNKISECYNWVDNIFLENIVIVPEHTDKKVDFFYHEEDGPLYEVASINVSHILKHGYNISGVKKVSVECLTVNELFDKYVLKNIDILYIDAEGMDDHIIKSVDFNSYSIDTIYFENLHLTQRDIYTFLINKGYEITMKTGGCGWSSLAKKIKTT